jgi:hypothetical protein
MKLFRYDCLSFICWQNKRGKAKPSVGFIKSLLLEHIKTSYLRIPDFSLILWTPGNRSLSGIGEFTGLSTHYKILEK